MAAPCPIINEFVKSLTSIARSTQFNLFCFPHNSPHYQIRSPFETIITIPIDPYSYRFLIKIIDQDPFNFVYDPENNTKRFIQKKAFIFLEFDEV